MVIGTGVGMVVKWNIMVRGISHTQHRCLPHSGQEATRDGNREAEEGGEMDKRES